MRTERFPSSYLIDSASRNQVTVDIEILPYICVFVNYWINSEFSQDLFVFFLRNNAVSAVIYLRSSCFSYACVFAYALMPNRINTLYDLCLSLIRAKK